MIDCKLSPARFDVLKACCHSVSDLPGVAAEVGVYMGGSLEIIARGLPKKVVHAFDTFAGIPEDLAEDDDAFDIHQFDDNSLQAVCERLWDRDNISYHEGTFPETLEGTGLQHRLFCLVHSDADIYRTTRDSLEFFYPRMSLGGIIVLDDYNWPPCGGCKRAVDEFAATIPDEIIPTVESQAIIVRGNVRHSGLTQYMRS
jgi:hypothetical protein